MRWTGCALAAIAAVAACGDTIDGARASCAAGGAINACPDGARTVEGACWRLVDCGAILLDTMMQRFDWAECVRRIDGASSVAQQITIDCIATSTCDALKVAGSPEQPDRHQMYCLRAGGIE